MISNNEIKYIKTLHQKKYRDAEKLFIVEGVKVVEELISSDFEVEKIFGDRSILEKLEVKGEEISLKELERISMQQTPSGILAIVKQKHFDLEIEPIKNQLSILLCNANDPGNLGTIIRLADWFGIDQIICSENSVDLYNPKVVQSSMGSIFRVPVAYCNLERLLQEIGSAIPVYGAFIEGHSLYSIEKIKKGLIVFGSESHGIPEEIEQLVQTKFTIPRIGRAESLNLATAVAITCSEFTKP
jgi:RNA methyltransferase, TrmH family